MAEWKGTKTNWGTDKGVDTDEFNRIEGNIQYNYDELEIVKNIGNKQIGDILFHSNVQMRVMNSGRGIGCTSWIKLKETRVAVAGNFRVKYSSSMDYSFDENKFYTRIYVNGSPKGAQRSVSGHNPNAEFVEDIYDAGIGSRIQVYGRICINHKRTGPFAAGVSNLKLYCLNFDGAQSVL